MVADESKIAYALKGKGKFIIATNELDEKTLSVEDLLKNYKGVLIHRTLEDTREIILNINPTRRHILQILGPPFEKIYANAP